ncbi:hypothetical protein EVAR_88992_1 [Eumeta japonica]|uniref:Uncharacterized protein n=1 Tax=Eumeta variegata TaxID=151549 RepID=A0A4C1X804_EUMVA|nr:hypothetical protein EVAR_88992_1 [Eumeta japonica]
MWQSRHLPALLENERAFIETTVKNFAVIPTPNEQPRDVLMYVTHTRTTSNERADELAGNTVLNKKKGSGGHRFPMSHIKKAIREAILEERQKKNTPSSTE